MSEELVTRQGTGIINFEESAMSVDSVINQNSLIQQGQKKVMKPGPRGLNRR